MVLFEVQDCLLLATATIGVVSRIKLRLRQDPMCSQNCTWTRRVGVKSVGTSGWTILKALTTMCGRNAEKKLKWLHVRVRLSGRAGTTFAPLHEATRNNYEHVKEYKFICKIRPPLTYEFVLQYHLVKMIVTARTTVCRRVPALVIDFM